MIKQNKKVLLFHAASAGEFEQIQPILRGINRDEFFIVQSFTSPTAYNIDQNTHLYDIKCYHPFDIFCLSYSGQVLDSIIYDKCIIYSFVSFTRKLNKFKTEIFFG